MNGDRPVPPGSSSQPPEGTQPVTREEPSTGRLEDLAARLIDDEPIDWASEESSAGSDGDRAVLRHLRVLREIAAVHGTAGSTGSRATPVEGQPSRWGHLRVLEHVGRGSFGDVFRAWDETLDREVALKLLHDRTDSLDEARRLARVRHPNFVTVYGAEIRDSRPGLWMEYLHGRTLARIVRDDGPFSASEALNIAIDVCRSVSAVHAAGLLHRDIKAQNVIRETGGRIVLMDLGAGLDRLLAAGGSGPAGTPLYMAPEVLNGRPATVQSDIYSIGVLLFHLVSGKYPVAGRTLDEVRRAHHSPRRLLRDLRPDLPHAFLAIVERALAREPSLRFTSAGAMQAALEGARGGAPGARRFAPILATLLVATAVLIGVAAAMRGDDPPRLNVTSIAVLPLHNLSGDPSQDYVAEGITDELIGALSRIPSLKVISRTSSRYYATHPRPIPAIGRELGVETVVEGTFNVAGDRVMVMTRLVDARADRAIAEQHAQRPARDLSEIQSDIARAIAAEIAGAPPPASRTRVDAGAYRDYLQGRYQLANRTPESLLAARDSFQRAIEADPLFTDAHAGLAVAYVLGGAFHAMPMADGFKAARAAAERTLALEEHSMAHAVLGYLAASQGYGQGDDWNARFTRALALDPNNTTARQWYALTLAGSGRYDEAVAQIEQARALDPLSMVLGSDAGVVYTLARRYDEAAEVLRGVIAMYPDFGEAHRQLGTLLVTMGDEPEAERSLERAAQLQGRTTFVLGELGYVKTRLGKREEARAIYRELRAMSASRAEAYRACALVAASLGLHREAAGIIDRCGRTLVHNCIPPLDRPGLERARTDPAVAAAVERVLEKLK